MVSTHPFCLFQLDQKVLCVDLAARVDVQRLDGGGAVGVDAWGMGSLVDALVKSGFETYDDVTKRGGSIMVLLPDTLPAPQVVATLRSKGLTCCKGYGRT